MSDTPQPRRPMSQFEASAKAKDRWGKDGDAWGGPGRQYGGMHYVGTVTLRRVRGKVRELIFGFGPSFEHAFADADRRAGQGTRTDTKGGA